MAPKLSGVFAALDAADNEIVRVERIEHENQVLRERVAELEAVLVEEQARTRAWVARADGWKARAESCRCASAAVARSGW